MSADTVPRCTKHGMMMTRRYSTSSGLPTGDLFCTYCEDEDRRVREATLAEGEWIDKVSMFSCGKCGSPLGVYRAVGPHEFRWQRCAACGSTEP